MIKLELGIDPQDRVALPKLCSRRLLEHPLAIHVPYILNASSKKKKKFLGRWGMVHSELLSELISH